MEKLFVLPKATCLSVLACLPGVDFVGPVSKEDK